MNQVITSEFFYQDPQALAIALLGKILRRKVLWNGKNCWLSARIVETEAYYLSDKASHSSLGYTDKRKAMFMAPGTIYMYYARGHDSLNFSALGEGNAVLIKAAYPYFDEKTSENQLEIMRVMNPGQKGPRDISRLCSGQTLLCRSLNLKVPDWDQNTFDEKLFYLDDVDHQVQTYIQCRRLGIPAGRDEHLNYRFIDFNSAHQATDNPLTKRRWREDIDYKLYGCGI